jgi:Rrf2 family nitric oxide-sensitive transcriptional repressor
MYLSLKEGRLATISEIAASYHISKAHLMKVAHQLGIKGLVKTVRGRQGGLRLARSPHMITVGEVIRETEPDLALVPCFEPVCADCAIVPACVLKRALHEARAVFFDVLDGYTLADLVRPHVPLRNLLGLHGGADDEPAAAV